MLTFNVFSLFPYCFFPTYIAGYVYTIKKKKSPRRPVVASVFVMLLTVFVYMWCGGDQGASLNALHRPAVPFAKCDQ